MNYQLAMMALEGLGRSPLRLTVDGSTITIEGSGASFKELARLCLLLGGEASESGEEVELTPPIHLSGGIVRLKVSE